MKKTKNNKTSLKEAGGRSQTGSGSSKGQVVRLKPGRGRTPWYKKVPPVTQYWRHSVDFVAEAWQELKKVTWPNRRETLGTTGVVLVLVLFLAVYLGLVDYGLSHLVRLIMH